MPSRATLRALGGRQFARDLADSGGVNYWAARLAVPIRSTGVVRVQQQTEYELRRFLAGRTHSAE